MRIPLTKYGWPQVVFYPMVILAVMAGVALGTRAVLQSWAIISIELLLAAILIWVLCFFRDPERSCPSDSNLLLAPADGQITDIEKVENPPAFLRKQERGTNSGLCLAPAFGLRKSCPHLAPLAGIEPAHTASEADALSVELQGHKRNIVTCFS